IDALIKDELDNHMLRNTRDLIEHIFPDSALPVSVDAVYKQISHLWSSDSCYYATLPRNKWVGCPDLTKQSRKEDVERAFSTFICQLSDQIVAVAGRPCNRCATEEFAPKANPVPGAPHERHPDVLIFDKDAPRTWETVLFPWEIKCNNNNENKRKADAQVVESARIIFEAQDDRRFIPGISVLGFRILLHIVDRAGEICSTEFNMNEEPLSFLRVIIGFMFASKETLGFDSAFSKIEDGTRCITVDGTTYKIVERVYHSHSIRGRGTSCWHATHDGKSYAIKDCWQDISRASTEADLLKRVQGLKGVSKLVAEETVKVQGKDETTYLIRKPVKDPRKRRHMECRLHRRLVLEPFGVPIEWFRTKKELIRGFMDVIRAHKDLLDKAGVIHRDISIHNIMLIEAIEDGDQHRKGLLIDLDYATDYPEPANRQTGMAERTGTLPFMAVDLLSAWGKVHHKPEWDLESLLYVLIWICIFNLGPNNSKKKLQPEETPLKGWFIGEMEIIADTKRGRMVGEDSWEKLLMWFSPYFEELKPCISEWRELFFVSKAPKTHEAVLSILEKTYIRLPDVE
ncbi:hypothetical protein NEOLEDRAFT_1031523, partial [Neolentinus lepideus HHB14362 ss-1]